MHIISSCPTVKVLNISTDNWTSSTESFEMHFPTTPPYAVSLHWSIYSVRSSGFSHCLDRTESLFFPIQALKNPFRMCTSTCNVLALILLRAACGGIVNHFPSDDYIKS
jgi:hypothetical protein